MKNKSDFAYFRDTLMSNEIMSIIESRIGSENSANFVSGILNIVSHDQRLQTCDVRLVISEALKSYSLNLPLTRELGLCYVLVYKSRPSFQIGYRGYLQLALRSGLYRYLNTDIVYRGENVCINKLQGTIDISGDPIDETQENEIGYFAFMQLLSGFEKSIYWSVEKIRNYAARYSAGYGGKSSPWSTDFQSMAKKTMLMQLLRRYCPMTVDISRAIVSESAENNNDNSSTEILPDDNNETFEKDEKKYIDKKDQNFLDDAASAKNLNQKKNDDMSKHNNDIDETQSKFSPPF